MITDRRQPAVWAGIAILLPAAWVAVLGLLTLALEPGRQLVLIGDPRSNMDIAIKAGGSLVDVGAHTVTVVSHKPGFVAALYRAGAPLVLLRPSPAGCLSPTLLKRFSKD
ncbi:hypothetical protein [Niveispirillum cyanobacteriorum]|uniref:Uncharacterized protein n=1 Tax=Niveispirillum cyanobacteriorum TaxID=1612173 RepID=A0A2K9N7X0_9PROT|nr:hypothetical protein [Niveispirillum cyanobacteriorum]AUN29230.1 hypothetical protein C0V82_02420 [Niveispirillum cyanobacteriorum]GGE66212.1 hypothetical protein GCM10011317_24410 [Niveispirillum cyanobacteriorum]